MTNRKQAMLVEFFAQVGIDKFDAEHIVEKLVDIDIRQAELSGQILAKKYAVAADDEFVSLSADEAHSLSSIAADEIRSVLGSDYEAYVAYTETFVHRRFIDQVSSSLPTPLNSSAREELVSIFHEETLKSASQIEVSSAEAADKDVQIKVLQAQIDSLDKRNKAIVERVHAYLTSHELDQFKLHMRQEIQRVEAMKLFVEST